MEISAEQVKELRLKSGAGIMECKKALNESAGDIDKAAEYLRIKGIAKAEQKAGRTANEGLVSSYIHTNNKVGVLLEVNCETDFVARTDEFKSLVNDIAMHIVGHSPYPQFVEREQVPKEYIEKEKTIFTAQAQESGKPAHIIEKIVEGKVDKWLSDICLTEQHFVKDPEIKIVDLIKGKSAKLGEKITVRRFVRFQVGEE